MFHKIVVGGISSVYIGGNVTVHLNAVEFICYVLVVMMSVWGVVFVSS